MAVLRSSQLTYIPPSPLYIIVFNDLASRERVRTVDIPYSIKINEFYFKSAHPVSRV